MLNFTYPIEALTANDRKHSPSLSQQKSSSIDTTSSQDNFQSPFLPLPYSQKPSYLHFDLNFDQKLHLTNIPNPTLLTDSTLPTSSTHLRKEKSQLCRKYMDIGRCPYGYKCKFAHGTHQLRQNEQVNSRYKTKECGAFFKEGYCRFGNRCNFMHKKLGSLKEKERSAELLKIMVNYRECVHAMRKQSRLLKILEISMEQE